MPALLLLEPLVQFFENLVQSAEGLDQALLLVGQVLLGEFAQPRVRDLGHESSPADVNTPEDGTEDAIEAVEVALVLHQCRAREIVEFLRAVTGETAVEASTRSRYSFSDTGTPACGGQ